MSTNTWVALICGMVLAAMSFYDDMRQLPPLPRLVVQIIAVGASFWWLYSPGAVLFFIVATVGCVAFINGINFLDGICGMLGFYSAVVLASLWLVFAYCMPVDSCNYMFITLCQWMLLGVAAFMVFNIKDKIFCGDTGSVFIGFFFAYTLVNIIICTKNIAYLTLVLVCFSDTGLTTIHRLIAGKNILLPHRNFIYQEMVSKFKLRHLTVAAIYAIMQIIVDLGFFAMPTKYKFAYFISMTIIFIGIYLIMRVLLNPKNQSGDLR